MPRSSFEYKDYHTSLTDELHVLKDRIRNLVRYRREDEKHTRSHWQTDGEWKESALRTMLRRHLPVHVHVGRGFILFKGDSSTQIDILIIRPDKPAVFKDGELVIVTPDAPGAMIEVKTELQRSEIKGVVEKLCNIGRDCKELIDRPPWLGLFVYEGERGDQQVLLDAACQAYQRTGVAINCISYGRSTFLRYWPHGEWEPGDSDAERKRAAWRSYSLEDIAPAYFIGNVVDTICGVDNEHSDFAWFTHHSGKRPNMEGEKRLEDCDNG